METGALTLLIFFTIHISFAQDFVLITTPRSPVYVAIGTKLVLTCRVRQADLKLRWTDESHTDIITSNKTTLSLVFDKINYSNGSLYYCKAVNQTSGFIVAQKTVVVKVGDPPPTPPPPKLKRVCGYPPSKVIMVYQYYNLYPLTPFPITVELFLSRMRRTNLCITANENFTIVEESRRIIHHSDNMSFEVDVSKYVKMLFPNFPYCSGPDNLFDCTTLCASVRTTGAFGSRFGTTMVEILQQQARCGKVDDLRVVAVGLDNITLAWNLPRCMRNTSKPKVHYQLGCDPSCGSKIAIPFPIEDDNIVAYRSISSLKEFTTYTFYVVCSLNNDFEDTIENVSISVQTKEGVPSAAPIIEKMLWQTFCSESNVQNGTALVSWMAPDEEKLHGKVRYYSIMYQVDDTTYIRKVFAGKLQAVISGLRMDEGFNFTITVCTGGGCSKPTRNFSLAPAKCKIPNNFEDGPLSVWKTVWIQALVGCLASVTFVILVFIAVQRVSRHRKEGMDLMPSPLPKDGITPSQIDWSSLEENTTITNPYACANGVELQTNNTCLSRTSSVMTCDTVI